MPTSCVSRRAATGNRAAASTPQLRNVALVLRSSKAVNKRSSAVTPWAWWAAPHPRFGAAIELLCGALRCKLDLSRVGEALPGKSLPPEQPPPCFLEVEPGRPY